MQKELTSKVIVLGLGNAGCKIIHELSLLEESSWMNLAVADTDRNSLERCGIDNSFEIGFGWTGGMGCGGDTIKGERAFAHPSRTKIVELLQGASLLIVVGGMGGGTGTPGTSNIARTAKKLEIPNVFIVTTPFSFEGHSRREIAAKGISMLNPDADIVVPIPNDILYSSISSDIPAGEAFIKSDIEIAKAVLGIAELIRCNNMLSADFSDLKSLLHKRKTVCSLGLGIATKDEGENYANLAVERLFSSPLLGGSSEIRNADAAIITVTGGPEMNIGEMRYVLEAAQNLISPETKLIVGANTDPVYTDRIQLTMVTVKYDSLGENQDDSQNKPSTSHEEGGTFKQQELPLLPVSKGIFTNTSRNIIASEDLDVPTFLRQAIHLDKGK